MVTNEFVHDKNLVVDLDGHVVRSDYKMILWVLLEGTGRRRHIGGRLGVFCDILHYHLTRTLTTKVNARTVKTS